MAIGNSLNISQSGFQSLNSTTGVFNGRTLTAGTGITITDGDGVSGDPVINSTGGGSDLHAARYIVSPGGSADGANYTDLASAYAAAVAVGAPQTVILQPATYTENITLTPGINIAAFGCDGSLNGTGNVIINGTLTMTTAGSVTISGIELLTNSANFLVVSGSEASVVNLQNCYLNCLNTDGITFSSSSSSAEINIFDCRGDVGAVSLHAWLNSSAGTLTIKNTYWTNSGLSNFTANNTAGVCNIMGSNFNFPISNANSNLSFLYSDINTSAINAIALKVNQTGTFTCTLSSFESGTAAAIQMAGGSTMSLYGCFMNSNNATGIAVSHTTGSGYTLIFQGLQFGGTAKLIDPSIATQTGGLLPGIARPLSATLSPSAGFIGEQIKSYIPSGSAVSLTTTSPANITSISLTPGIWDVSSNVGFLVDTTTVSNAYNSSISTTTATPTNNLNDDMSEWSSTSGIQGFSPSLSVSGFRVAPVTTTTYYLVATGTFSVSTVSAFGKICATRVS